MTSDLNLSIMLSKLEMKQVCSEQNYQTLSLPSQENLEGKCLLLDSVNGQN